MSTTVDVLWNCESGMCRAMAGMGERRRRHALEAVGEERRWKRRDERRGQRKGWVEKFKTPRAPHLHAGSRIILGTHTR